MVYLVWILHELHQTIPIFLVCLLSSGQGMQHGQNDKILHFIMLVYRNMCYTHSNMH